jgi:hypothetical protein
VTKQMFVWVSAQTALADDFMIEGGAVLDPQKDVERRQHLVMALSIAHENGSVLASTDGITILKTYLGLTLEVPTEQFDDAGRQCSASVLIPRAVLRKTQWMDYTAGQIEAAFRAAGRTTDMSRVGSALVESDVIMNARKSLRVAREVLDAPRNAGYAIRSWGRR